MDSRQVTKIITDLASELEKNDIPVDQIVLFGSWSSGMATDESDIDIACVSPRFIGISLIERHRIAGSSVRMIINKHRIPIDLIPLTPGEYVNEESQRMTFVRQGEKISLPI